MKTLIVRFVDFILGPIYGKKQFHSLFGFLHSISLKGMNLRYSSIRDNGEKWLIQQIINYFRGKKVVPVIFDVGANQGGYSLELLKISQGQINLYSFEPSKKTFQLLLKNIAASNAHVRLINSGFSNEITKAELCYNINDPATSSLYSANTQDTIIEEVELTTIDNFCHLHAINYIHFLKIDVEGNEIKVLKGAKQMLNLVAIDFIQFEFGPRNVDSRTFLKDFYTLLEEKYFIYKILKNGLYQMHPYHQDYEAFFAGNYLAVNRQMIISDLLRD